MEIENAKFQGWFHAGGQLVGTALFFVTLFLGAVFIARGLMTAGMLLTFINLVNHLMYPLTGLAGQWAGYQRSVTAVERISNVLNHPVDSQDLPAYVKGGRVCHAVECKEIQFGYDVKNPVLQRLNVSIPAKKWLPLWDQAVQARALFSTSDGVLSSTIWSDLYGWTTR